MLVPTGHREAEITVKSSKFISQIHILASREEVKDIVSGLRGLHPGAAHVVWAFAWGRNGDVFGYSDDREPKGTAGRPVYEVLKGSGISNCLVTVVRYFGGTKLGTGGLVRAYTDAAKAVLDNAPVKEHIETAVVRLLVDYSVYERVKQIIGDMEGETAEEEFLERVSILVSIPSAEKDRFSKEIMDCTSGKAGIHFL